MVRASGRHADDRIALLPPRFAEATVELVGANAVMAGCKAEVMPVIVTALEALVDPEFDLYGVQATTHPCGILVLVSGPLAPQLGINGEGGCFGPGYRANATIGRALRLILQNVGGAFPQETDLATQGSPAKFTYCFAENSDASPWEPFHVHKGFSPADTTVTVSAAEAPHNINDHVSTEPDGLMFTFAQTIATMGKNNAYVRDSDFFVVFCPEHAAVLGRAGWTRADVQTYLFERARIPHRQWRRGGMFGMLSQGPVIDAADDDMDISMTISRDDIHVLIAGGGGRHSSWIPTFGAHGKSVTRAIPGRRSREINERDRYQKITELLAPTADSLRADGYDLAISSESRGLRLAVTAGDAACADCLVPVEVFRGLVSDALRRGGVEVSPQNITVVYPHR